MGVASAPDFLIQRIESLDAEEKAGFDRVGFIKYPDAKHGPYTITKEMFVDAHLHRVFSDDRLSAISCKVVWVAVNLSSDG